MKFYSFQCFGEIQLYRRVEVWPSLRSCFSPLKTRREKVTKVVQVEGNILFNV